MNVNNNSAEVLCEFSLILKKCENRIKNSPCNMLHETERYIFQLIEYLRRYTAKQQFTESQRFHLTASLLQLLIPHELLKQLPKETLNSMEHQKSFFINMIRKCSNFTSFLSTSDEENEIGSFLKLMDLALEECANLQNDTLEAVKNNFETLNSLIEQILCFTMTVAHVTDSEDCKIIKGSCQSVLNNIQSLKKEIEKTVPNKAMTDLFIEVTIDSLCSLETKVNTSVLKLCVKIFCNFSDPLQDLLNICLNLDTHTTEVENLIGEFDLILDQIHQIGCFSLACSTPGLSQAKIKAYMASFAVFEVYLVPACLDIIKNKSEGNISFVETLKLLWIYQVNEFKKTVHNVIEPTAYCKVVYEDIKQELTNIQSDKLLHFSKIKIFKRILLPAKELENMLKKWANIKDEDIKKQLNILTAVIEELEAASNTLLNFTNFDDKTMERINKRCNILITTVKRLWIAMNKNNPIEEAPKIVKDNDESDNNLYETKDLLQHLETTSKFILKDRSIMASNMNVLKLANKLSHQTFQRGTRNISFHKLVTSNDVPMDKFCKNIMALNLNSGVDSID